MHSTKKYKNNYFGNLKIVLYVFIPDEGKCLMILSYNYAEDEFCLSRREHPVREN